MMEISRMKYIGNLRVYKIATPLMGIENTINGASPKASLALRQWVEIGPYVL